MDAAQIWAVIGVLAAAFFGMTTIVATLFTHVLRTEIGGLHAEMNARFAAVDERFDAVHRCLDGMDRDIQLLTSRGFGTDRG